MGWSVQRGFPLTSCLLRALDFKLILLVDCGQTSQDGIASIPSYK
jgi:hypothetical protein